MNSQALADDPIFRLTLRCGAVYYFLDRQFSSPQPHYFIVVNANPLADETLLLVVCASDLEKVTRRRRGLPPETLVIISQGEYHEFSQDTIVDCNHVLERPASLLSEKKKAGDLGEYLDKLPAAVLRKIIIGIHKSPTVKSEVISRIPSV
ncbi:MAG: hypothetical protein NT011_01725 [Kiritimatiellaeota bacterium]|nr:hypothetical protein [Kiritimatiellota bacterium]